MTSHQTFLTKFKGDLWNHCMNENIFSSQHLENVTELTKIIDNIVSNYQSHIFQNDNPKSMFPKLIQELKMNLMSHGVSSSQELKNIKLNKFQQDLEQKQQEFKDIIKEDRPKHIEFEKLEDEPLSNDKLEALLAQQMKERDHLVQNNNAQADQPPFEQINEENIVLSNKFIPNLPSDHSSLEHKNEEFIQESIVKSENSKAEKCFQRILEQIETIQEMQKKQNIILNKMISSQISILEKLK